MRAENGDMCPSTQITASIQKSGSGTTTTNLRYIFLNVFDGGPYGHLGHFGLVAADAATRRLTPYDGYGSYLFESCQDVRALRQDATEGPLEAHGMLLAGRLRRPSMLSSVGRPRACGSSWTRSARANRRGRRRGSRAT